jgi:hypothetical protein
MLLTGFNGLNAVYVLFFERPMVVMYEVMRKVTDD